MHQDILVSYKSFLALNKLKNTKQRRLIFETFMSQEEHLTAEDLYLELQQECPQIGQSTVYRTLKLMCDTGFAHRLGGYLQSQSSYFEPVAQEHHDHLVCLVCGGHFDFRSDPLEKIQEEIARERGFKISHHTHILYGECESCVRKRFPDEQAD